MICPLCQGVNSIKYDEDKFRSYHLCHNCSLIFVPREKILSFELEAARYQAHQNEEEDPHYRHYLSQTALAIQQVVPQQCRGLDFGCGKTQLMAQIFKDLGHSVDSYDLYFHPREEIWSKSFDFIVLSEVLEHLSQPVEVMRKLSNLLTIKGKIFIKTKLYPANPLAFSSWFYKRDLTHVQFFDDHSLEKLGQLMNMKGPHRTVAPDLYEFTK